MGASQGHDGENSEVFSANSVPGWPGGEQRPDRDHGPGANQNQAGRLPGFAAIALADEKRSKPSNRPPASATGWSVLHGGGDKTGHDEGHGAGNVDRGQRDDHLTPLGRPESRPLTLVAPTPV
jgi:hypothetical protein